MNQEQPLYEEKQYLGYNQLSMLRRLSLALFCFGLYWWKVQNEKNGDLFFLLGIIIIIISILLLFVLHVKIRVYKTYLELDGLWTTRKVNIDLKYFCLIKKWYSLIFREHSWMYLLLYWNYNWRTRSNTQIWIRVYSWSSDF